MNKYLLTLTLILLSTLAFGQHLSVKGVEIDGPSDSFIAKMKAKGLKSVPYAETDGTTALKGTFAGHEDSYVFVYHDGNLVSKVGILLPGKENWKDVKSEYLSLKESYAEKYKVTPQSIERFADEYQEYSGVEYIYLENGKAEYKSIFTVDGGLILLSISYLDAIKANTLWKGIGYSGRYAVVILYVDAENETSKQESYIDDL